MKTHMPLPILKRRENGAVLIIGLIFLVVLTLLVVSALRTATLEERMAGNTRNQQVAFQAAEAVLREAGATIFNGAPFDPWDPSAFVSGNAGGCSNGLCGKPTAGTERWKTITWDSQTLTRSFTNAGALISNVPTQPRYFIEMITPPSRTGASTNNQCEDGVFNLTARGIGPNGAEAFVQATYKVKVSDCSALVN
jgi:type IV pilus assembly protein PilX